MAAPQTSPDYNNLYHNCLCVGFNVVNGRPQDQAICIFPKNGCYNIFPCPTTKQTYLLFLYFLASSKSALKVYVLTTTILLRYTAATDRSFFFEIMYLKTKAGDDS